jgi:uncharacterized membrane protein
MSSYIQCHDNDEENEERLILYVVIAITINKIFIIDMSNEERLILYAVIAITINKTFIIDMSNVINIKDMIIAAG